MSQSTNTMQSFAEGCNIVYDVSHWVRVDSSTFLFSRCKGPWSVCPKAKSAGLKPTDSCPVSPRTADNKSSKPSSHSLADCILFGGIFLTLPEAWDDKRPEVWYFTHNSDITRTKMLEKIGPLITLESGKKKTGELLQWHRLLMSAAELLQGNRLQ